MPQQCWAYDKNRRRCEKPAGHEEAHAILIEWSDSECYDPSSGPVKAQPAADVSHETEPKKIKPCVACKHSHKGGSCKCGCHTHIG